MFKQCLDTGWRARDWTGLLQYETAKVDRMKSIGVLIRVHLKKCFIEIEGSVQKSVSFRYDH